MGMTRERGAGSSPWLELVVDVLATYRLTRLATHESDPRDAEVIDPEVAPPAVKPSATGVVAGSDEEDEDGDG